MIAVVLEMLQVPALTFALGMYLPLELNSPALVGGYLHHLVTRKAARRGGNAGRSLRERGVVIASGLMAGGALGGVVGVAIRLATGFDPDTTTMPLDAFNAVSQCISIVGFLGLVAYVWLNSNRKVDEA
jgi:hypothetical protein